MLTPPDPLKEKNLIPRTSTPSIPRMTVASNINTRPMTAAVSMLRPSSRASGSPWLKPILKPAIMMRMIAIPAAIPSTRWAIALAIPAGVVETHPSPKSSPGPPLQVAGAPKPNPPDWGGVSARAVLDRAKQAITESAMARMFFSRSFFIGTLDITYYPCFGQGGLEDR